ncbi:MAG: pyruvate carboxylase subunit B, partial [Atribacterota bacterium]|nr:pyruvate carboxylase subunit B [Atribacterota bacterium]
MVKIVDTTLRDAHQSLIATRMRTEDMLPILDTLDSLGFYSLECWGGATFDTSLRFLAEDPWERLRKIRDRVVKTPLQMLLRGQNLLGYRHYSDDIVKKFVPLCVKNGIRIIRVFDALNDIRNMELSIKLAKDAGAIVQGAISYTVSPVHTVEAFVELAHQFRELGCDVIC